MVLDERAKKLAEIVINYSVKITSSDKVSIGGEQAYEEFARGIGRVAELRGAKVVYDLSNPTRIRDLIRNGSALDLITERDSKLKTLEGCTARIGIDASEDPDFFKDVDPKKIAEYSRVVSKPYSDIVCGDGKSHKGLKWNIVAYPSEREARKAGMSLEDYTDFLFGATNIDWETTKKEMQRIKDLFDGAQEVHILVPGQTDLRLSLTGRKGQICAGTFNMPDGEVFYGPIENSAEGHITFPYKSSRGGQEVEGIRLVYKDGLIVKHSARSNQEFLEAMLDLKGVRRIGELGIGCNFGIKRYTQNLLFDEKIGGTVHIAIGESYFEGLDNGGGLNEGEIHWDLVCDLRKINGLPGGELYVSNRLVQKAGIWCFEGI